MKLTTIENSYLSELLELAIESIQTSLSNINVENEKDVQKRVEEGDNEIEDAFDKLKTFKSIYLRLQNVNEPGASLKQINALDKTASKRKKATEDKILNAINLLDLMNIKISVVNVSRESGLSFNTTKKYRAIIESRESARINKSSNNQKVS